MSDDAIEYRCDIGTFIRITARNWRPRSLQLSVDVRILWDGIDKWQKFRRERSEQQILFDIVSELLANPVEPEYVSLQQNAR